MVCCFEEGALDASDSRNEQQSNERTAMKNKTLAGLIVAGLVMSGAAFSLLAQNGPERGGDGKGYGGPPQSQEERAARQAACLEKNGGVCPNGGPRANCPGYGQGGQGQGNGKCARQGLRDGTGPRSANGTCPNAPAKNQK
jgi:hypothetical protein